MGNKAVNGMVTIPQKSRNLSLVLRSTASTTILLFLVFFLITIALIISKVTSKNRGSVTDAAKTAESRNRRDVKVDNRGDFVKSTVDPIPSGTMQQMPPNKHIRNCAKLVLADEYRVVGILPKTILNATKCKYYFMDQLALRCK